MDRKEQIMQIIKATETAMRDITDKAMADEKSLEMSLFSMSIVARQAIFQIAVIASTPDLSDFKSGGKEYVDNEPEIIKT